MLIEIAETHPPQFGKKVATIVAKNGEKFEIWPEKLPDIRVGAKYDVHVEEREYQGRTIRKITKGVPEFVATVLAAMIAAGVVKNDKRQLFETTQILRGLWGATFGGKPA